jgi:uncharacterized protein YccT (UPF0319 family)
MHLKNLLVGVVGLCASLTVYAATLAVDSRVELMAFDGKEVTKQDLAQGKMINIAPGSHQVVYRFNASLRDGSSNRLLTIAPNVSLIDFKAEDDLYITLPKFNAYTQAQAYFRRDAQWSLEDSKGNQTNLSYEVLPGQGFMPFADIEKPLAAYNLALGNQYSEVGAAKVLTDEVMFGGNDLSLLNTFKLLYNNATPDQRQQIKTWLNSQTE